MVPYKHRDLLILIAENHNCNRIRTHNDLFCKKMLNHFTTLASLAKLLSVGLQRT